MSPLARGARQASGGLAPRLIVFCMVVVSGTVASMTIEAGRLMEREVEAEYASKAEAIALAVASALARGPGGQGGQEAQALRRYLEATRAIRGVSYVYVVDGEGGILAHTFRPHFPPALSEVNELPAGQGEGPPQVLRGVRLELGNGQVVEVTDVAARVGDAGVVHVGMDEAEVAANLSGLRLRLAQLGALFCALGVVASALGARWLLRRLRALTACVEQVGSSSALADRLGQLASGDEIGALAASFQAMVIKLREIPLALGTSAEELRQAMAALDESLRRQDRALTAQAAALAESRKAMSEVQQGSTAAATSAQQALSETGRAEELSGVGRASLQSCGETVLGIQRRAEALVQRIGRLTAHAERAGEVVEAVKEFSQQLNIRAVNASLEAMRAGEAGKGMWTVAQDMRELSVRSRDEADRIHKLLGELRRDIEASVEEARREGGRVAEGAAFIRRSGEHLEGVVASLQATAETTRHIANAVQEQHQELLDVNSGLTLLGETTAGVNDGMRQVSLALSNLEQCAGRLDQLITSFRV